MPTPPAYAYTRSPPKSAAWYSETVPPSPARADAASTPLRHRLTAGTSAAISSAATTRKMLRVRSPHSSCSITAARAPGTRSTGPGAAGPDRTGSTAAPVPRSSRTRAAGPVNGARPVRETARNNTPTKSRAMTKCTIWGCRAARDTVTGLACWVQEEIRPAGSRRWQNVLTPTAGFREDADPRRLPRLQQAAEKLEQRPTLERRQTREPVARPPTLAPVEENRLFDRLRPAVVQERLPKAQSHERCGAEFRGTRLGETDVGQFRAHVVEQQIGVRVDRLEAEGAHAIVTGEQRRYMAGGASKLGKDQGPRDSAKGQRLRPGRGEQLDEGLRGREVVLRQLWIGSRVDARRDRFAPDAPLGGLGRTGNSHLLDKRGRDERSEARYLRLAAEPPDPPVGCPVDAPGDPVVVPIVRVGER